MNEIYEKHRILIKVSAIICVILIVWGTLLVADVIQRQERNSNVTEEVVIKKNDGHIDSYNVGGMTDEEIERALEIKRSQEGNK